MFYILKSDIALRSWKNIPFAYQVAHQAEANLLSKDDFRLMLQCDGKTDLEETNQLRMLQKLELIESCKEGEKTLTSWQQYRNYDNLYTPYMNLQITSRCNYNCLHCFNAKDNEHQQSELSLEQILDILDQAEGCGVHSLTITGGEPLVHKDFQKIVDAVYERNMMIRELNTNGQFLTQELLDHFKNIGCQTAVKISFDGVGFHDWMRNKKGAEEEALRAMKLCIANGFETRAQINLNRQNKDCMVETLELLDELGLSSARIIRTTEVPRLMSQNGDICMDITEYYDSALETIEAYAKKTHQMGIVVWQFLSYDPKSRCCSFTPKCNPSSYRETIPLCKGVRGMIAVNSDGGVFPCMQSVGTFMADGVKTQNLFETPLKDILQPESEYMKMADLRISERLGHNPECAQCPYWKACQGGCPAIGYICSGGDWLGVDQWKCAFFKGGYHLKKIPGVEILN